MLTLTFAEIYVIFLVVLIYSVAGKVNTFFLVVRKFVLPYASSMISLIRNWAVPFPKNQVPFCDSCLSISNEAVPKSFSFLLSHPFSTSVLHKRPQKRRGKSLMLLKSILAKWVNTYWTPSLRNYSDFLPSFPFPPILIILHFLLSGKVWWVEGSKPSGLWGWK